MTRSCESANAARVGRPAARLDERCLELEVIHLAPKVRIFGQSGSRRPRCPSCWTSGDRNPEPASPLERHFGCLQLDAQDRYATTFFLGFTAGSARRMWLLPFQN
jgi:hypothetical protein